MLTAMMQTILSYDVQHVHFTECVHVFYYLLHVSCFRITNGVGGFGHFYTCVLKVCLTTLSLFWEQRYWGSEFDFDLLSRTALVFFSFSAFLLLLIPF